MLGRLPKVTLPHFTQLPTTKVTFKWIFCLDKLWENINYFLKNVEISQNGPLIRGVIKEFIFSQIAWSPISCIWVAFRVATASRVEDFGLQAILEKMNSLITPWLVDHLGIFQTFFKFFDIFSKFVKTKNSIESHFSIFISQSFCSDDCTGVKRTFSKNPNQKKSEQKMFKRMT